MTAYEKIQQRMRENERCVMRKVRKANHRGALFQFWYGHGLGGNGHDRALSNALRRLMERGRVVSLSRRGRYGHGYKVPTARAPKTGWRLSDSFGRLPGDRYYMG